MSALQSQEYKGEDEAKINKTKASITRLQSLIIVTSQAVSTTSIAIIGLKDSNLVPQLVEICHGLVLFFSLRSSLSCFEMDKGHSFEMLMMQCNYMHPRTVKYSLTLSWEFYMGHEIPI